MTIQDMTKKKQKKRGMTKSSSSGETERSKIPKDVLELGKYLVHELGYEDGVDTLGRWMSHHLAELINKVENATTEHEREYAQKSVIETILRIWDHRASMPGEVYPLESYKDAIKMLDLLKPDSNPFSPFWYHDGTKVDQLAANLFDKLIRIIIATLLMKIEPDKRFTEVDPTVFGSLNETEKHVLRSIQEWGSLFEEEEKSTTRSARKYNERAGDDNINLNNVMLKLIDETMISLKELQSEIQENCK